MARTVPGLPGRLHLAELAVIEAAADLEHYRRTGLEALSFLDVAMGLVHRRLEDAGAILDMPCGYGRVLRWMVQRVEPGRVTACDIEAAAVGFCAAEFGARPLQSDADFSRVALAPAYDLIWVGSLFTHLPEPQCHALLDVLAQHLARGGALVFTTHGVECLSRLDGYGKEFGARQALYERAIGAGHVAFSPYDGSPDFGITIHPEAAVRMWLAEYETGLRVLDFQPQAWDQHQDVWMVAAS